MIIYQSRIYRADLQANPDVLYVFGDNEQRIGYGGQAGEMRDEPNAVGVATLEAPGVFWTETNVQHQCEVIDRDLARIVKAIVSGQLVVWPLDGIGTGLAALESHSPTTFQHLSARFDQLPHIFGTMIFTSPLYSPDPVMVTRGVLDQLNLQPEGLVR